MTGTGSAVHRADTTRPQIDTSRPHPARVYDWFLGGKDNYPVDEQLGRQITTMDPAAPWIARANRRFMRRATGLVAREAGIRQYLDIGTGIPTEPNLHQVAQSVAPDARVVYVDNDPIVLAHAEALLRGTAEGVTEYIQADAREPHSILEQAARVIDFDRPVALSLIDVQPENVRRGVAAYAAGGVTLVARSHAEVGRFFEGLQLMEPGIVSVADWRPEQTAEGDETGDGGDGPVSLYGGVVFRR